MSKKRSSRNNNKVLKALRQKRARGGRAKAFIGGGGFNPVISEADIRASIEASRRANTSPPVTTTPKPTPPVNLVPNFGEGVSLFTTTAPTTATSSSRTSNAPVSSPSRSGNTAAPTVSISEFAANDNPDLGGFAENMAGATSAAVDAREEREREEAARIGNVSVSNPAPTSPTTTTSPVVRSPDEQPKRNQYPGGPGGQTAYKRDYDAWVARQAGNIDVTEGGGSGSATDVNNSTADNTTEGTTMTIPTSGERPNVVITPLKNLILMK